MLFVIKFIKGFEFKFYQKIKIQLKTDWFVARNFINWIQICNLKRNLALEACSADSRWILQFNSYLGSLAKGDSCLFSVLAQLSDWGKTGLIFAEINYKIVKQSNLNKQISEQYNKQKNFGTI